MRRAPRGPPARRSTPLKRVAIVGAGFGGTALAATLLECSADPIQVLLFERANAFGAGVAFATDDPLHLLNVPAAKMSAFVDRPADFTDWLNEQGIEVGDGFVPRRHYRNYLQDRLRRPPHHPGSKLIRVSQEVVAAEGSFRLTTREGGTYDADYVVLATGYAPRATRGLPPYEPRRWPSGNIRKVAIVGAGLTALDAAASVFERYPGVEVEIYSRHGRLPQPFRIGTKAVTLASEPPLGNLRELLRWLRAEIARTGWEPMFDAMRFRWESLWQSLDDRDRQRFIRHLSHHFNRFRHRVPPALWLRISPHQDAGRLTVRVGHVCDVSPNRLRFVDGTERRFDAVIDASGVSFTPDWDRDRLLAGLLEDGRIERGRIDLGFQISPKEGRLFTLGPTLRGERWESTAVPDICRQVHGVSQRILGSA